MSDEANAGIDSPSGGHLTIETAIANLRGEDRGLRMYAAWWLGKFRVNEPEAIESLMVALEDEADRTEAGGYPLRRNAARALGKLRHPSVPNRAVPALIKSLECSDFYVREAAAQSLEQLGDPSAIPVLMRLLNNEVPGTLPSPVDPDLVQPYDAILEALGELHSTTAPSESGEAQRVFARFLDHPIERVRYSAARALYQVTQDHQYGDLLVKALAGHNLSLRRSALADLSAIGYLAAADAIAQTLAENSLKLIALKGLLEHQVKQTPLPELSDGAVHVMTLMDSLL